MISCPHCKAHKIFTAKVPKDMIVVLPCPACHELVVLFQNRALAVSRRILEHGTFEERTTHFAQLIAKFLEQGFPFGGMEEAAAAQAEDSDMLEGEFAEHGEMARKASRLLGPISQDELEEFVRVDLSRIDDPDYFKKNLN